MRADQGSRLQSRHRLWRVCVPLLCGLFAAPLSWGVDQRSGIVVQHVITELKDDVYYLDARIEYDFSDDILEALDSGVPITVALEIDIAKPRDWLWDDTVAELTQFFRIEFHALTRQYVVINLNSRAQNSYHTRHLALTAMGKISELPLLDKRLLKADTVYQARLRAKLVIADLPTPLRPWAYLSSEWRMASEWYIWQLN